MLSACSHYPNTVDNKHNIRDKMEIALTAFLSVFTNYFHMLLDEADAYQLIYVN